MPGLPAEWEQQANRQFGISPTILPKEDVMIAGQSVRVPAVLELLRKQLIKFNAEQLVVSKYFNSELFCLTKPPLAFVLPTSHDLPVSLPTNHSHLSTI